MIPIAVLEDHPAVISGILNEVEKHDNFAVLIHETTFTDFYKKLETKEVFVAVVDIILEDSDGIEHIISLIDHFPEIDFIAYTSIRDLKLIQQLYTLGIKGYLHKSKGADQLFEVIRHVFFEKARYIPDNLKEHISNKKTTVPVLSDREKVIMKHLVEGKSTAEIAALEFISENTVAFHRKNLFKKLGSPNAAAFVRDAILHGLYKG